ncbi:TPA: hypothetical protein O9M52_002588 [Staphylococcus aureus]|nr:hypothetical protein [Staphylococcus epidermidis]HCW0036304.1 hypothetical protein [Staphylococcus aureus]HDC8354710.1 hypothetical protein [Staphylococcus aureus]HDR0659186.1 hypothetical protein [Staphylococcus aureus]
MKHTVTRSLAFFIKLFLLFIFIFTMALPTTSSYHQANAVNQAVIDGQQGCTTGGDSGDKKSKDDSDSDSDSDSSGESSGDAENLTKEQKKNIKKAYDILNKDYGVSAQMVAGMMGNWMQESHINPKSVEGITGVPTVKQRKEAEKSHEDYHTGLGLGQWSYERNDMLVDFAKEKGGNWWDFDIQMKFIADGDSAKDRFRDIVSDAGDDPGKNANTFHEKWEISADNDQTVQKRADNANAIWKYMKEEGMTGKKDQDKISKIGSKKSKGNDDKGASSADDTSDKKSDDPCKEEEEDKDGGGDVGGEIGDSTKINGKSGEVKEGSWTWDDMPKKYKKHVTIPKFKKEYLDKPGNNYVTTGNKGQCTELTWAYMNQLWKGKQPTDDGTTTDGYRVHEVYKKKGAKTTHKPTVGYAFSSSAPYGGASSTPPGHTGLVAGVMDDGGFILVSYNIPPKMAPSREPVYSYVDGMPKDAGDKLIFFSGIDGGKPNKKEKSKKDD